MSNHKLFRSILITSLLASGITWVHAQEAGSALSIEAREQAMQAREAELARREQAMQSSEQAMQSKLQQLQSSTLGGQAQGENPMEALPNAKAGQCFAKVLTPAQYKTVTEKVMIREAANKIEIIPAKYQIVEQKVEIKPASEKILEIPAVYKRVEEKILMSPERLVWRKGRSHKSGTAPASWVASALTSGVSGTIEAGQCFVEYKQEARYKTVQEKLLKREASARIEIIPATYEWIQQKVLIKEASEKIITVPAVYETQENKMLERAAYTTWKKGRGPIEKLNDSTGDIMCLIEVPAKYKTISKKVLKMPATTKRITIPAVYDTVKVRKLVTPAQEKRTEIPAEFQMLTKKVKESDEVIGWRAQGSNGEGQVTGKVICRAKIDGIYKTISKQVIASPATTRKTVIPAENKLVKVRKLVTPAQEKKTEIPAIFSEVSKRKKVVEEKLAWRPILCETNTSPGLVTKLQQALKNAGFNPGLIDGVMGRQTYVAIDKFQRKQGFETGGLTLRTLKALNVSVN